MQSYFERFLNGIVLMRLNMYLCKQPMWMQNNSAKTQQNLKKQI